MSPSAIWDFGGLQRLCDGATIVSAIFVGLTLLAISAPVFFSLLSAMRKPRSRRPASRPGAPLSQGRRGSSEPSHVGRV
jgi:hypothetical protein